MSSKSVILGNENEMNDDLVKRLRFGSLTHLGASKMNLEAAATARAYALWEAAGICNRPYGFLWRNSILALLDHPAPAPTDKGN